MKKVEQVNLRTVPFYGRDVWMDVYHNAHSIKEMDGDYIKNCVHYIIRKRESDKIQWRIPIFKDYLYSFLCELDDRKECVPFIEWVDWKPVVWYKEIDFVYLKV